MTPEFRQGERVSIVSAPCMFCGKDSDCYATDNATGKDICRDCCILDSNGIDPEKHYESILDTKEALFGTR